MNKLLNENERHFLSLISEEAETKTEHAFDSVASFPLEVQDKIIEDISLLDLCTKEAVASVIAYYAKLQRNEVH